jgi:hypothetical protein
MRKSDGVKMAKDAIASYTSQKEEFGRELRAVNANQEKAKIQLEESITQMCEGLVQSIETEDIEAVSNETGASFLSNSLKKLYVKLAKDKERVTEIEQIEVYQDRDNLLNSKYPLLLGKEEEGFKVISASLKAYDFKEFKWLYNNGVHKEGEVNSFNKFLRFITLASRRQKKAESIVESKLKTDFSSAAEDFDSLSTSQNEFNQEIAKIKSLKENLNDLIKEKGNTEKNIALFEDNSIVALQGELNKYLADIDFNAIHPNLRSNAKIICAKCHAIQAKVKYFEDMKVFLKKEMADRATRINDINKVKNKWARKPYDSLRGDKSKWLVATPKMKQASTTKRTRWVSTMNHNVYVYDSYDSYNNYMYLDSFLAYDAFSYRCEERMPYEGFSRDVISELDEYRDEHDQEKADYSEFEGSTADEGIYSSETDSNDDDAAGAAAAAMAVDDIANEASEADDGDLSDAS